MFNNIKNSFKISLVYISLFIGAGFASGKELIYYFLRYNKIGFVGIAVSSLILGYICFVILDICYNKNIKNYNTFVDEVLGKKLGMFLEVIVIFFMFIFFSTMLSAGAIAVKQVFNTNYTLNIIIISFLCFIIFLWDIEGILAISTIVSPIMIIGGIFISLYIFFYDCNLVFLNLNSILLLTKDNWVSSSLIYISYNIITVISVLSSMDKYISSSKISKLSGIFSGILIFLLGIIMSLPIFIHYNDVLNCEIPMLEIVHKYNIKVEYFYLIILICAIFTTAISNGFAIINWIFLKFNFNKNILIFFIILLGAVFSYVGFSNFVKTVYPIFAIVGVIEIILILKYFIKNIQNKT